MPKTADDYDREMASQALPTDSDTESKLARMKEITDTQRKLEGERVALREDLADKLDGPRYFLDANGVKRFGYVQRTQEEIIELEKLAGYVSPEIIEAVSKRVPDREAFRKAVARGDIPVETAAKVVRYKDRAASIRFGSPYDDE